MNIVRRNLGLPSSLAFRVVSFATEEEVLTNLEFINASANRFAPCLAQGAGK